MSRQFCVIGAGFVGQAVYAVLHEKYGVHVIEPAIDIMMHADGRTVKDIHKFTNIDGFIICVPTPEADNGRCDDTLVTEYVNEITKHHPKAQILIKSTTSVDTLASFNGNVTFSPEFLRGSTGADPTQEFKDCDFSIYGGTGGRWWHEVFSQVLDIKDVRFMDIESAGFLKYTENAFLALKVMFFNEVNALYNNTIDGNYDTMIEALALDKRIGMSHTQVPGPDGQYGFGGHCLPKDTSEFAKWAEYNEHPLHLLELARMLNKSHRG